MFFSECEFCIGCGSFNYWYSVYEEGTGSISTFFCQYTFNFCYSANLGGLLWLALADPNYKFLEGITTYVFLFFAQVTWPLWVPLAVWRFEHNRRYKMLQRALLVIGVVVSVWLAFCLANYTVSAKIDGRHISYLQHYPGKLKYYGGVFYVMATILPPFLSSFKKMKFLGMGILVSYVITEIFYENYVVSVWCFFAAILSGLVYLVMKDIK